MTGCDNAPEPVEPKPADTGFVLPQDVVFPDIAIDPPTDSLPMSGKEVFDYVKNLLNRGFDFEWGLVDDYVLWSATVAGDSTMVLGYKPEGVTEIDYATLDLKSYEWQYARAYTIEFLMRELRRLHPDSVFVEENVIWKEQKLLPVMYLKLADYEAIARLRKLPTVRYLEPHGYNLEEYE